MSRQSRYKTLPYTSARYHPDPSPDFTQWWYLDADFDCGHRLMTILMPRAFGRMAGHDNGPDPVLHLVVTDPEGRHQRSHRFHVGDFEGAKDRMFVRFGESTLEARNGRYRLHLDQDGLGCDLEYIPLYPPWPPMPGRGGFMNPWLLKLAQGSLTPGRYFHYAAMIPRAKIRGRLRLNDQEIEVQGEGYHEQGRVNAPLTSLFTYWYWTRFFLGDWTFVYSVGEAPRHALNTRMRALLAYYRDDLVADLFDVTGLVLDYRVERHGPTRFGRDDIPERAVFSARQPGFRLRVDMDLTEERDAFSFQPFDGNSPRPAAWFQHLMQVRAKIRWQGRRYDLRGEGIFETMMTGAR